jgi:hypothetical protein
MWYMCTYEASYSIYLFIYCISKLKCVATGQVNCTNLVKIFFFFFFQIYVYMRVYVKYLPYGNTIDPFQYNQTYRATNREEGFLIITHTILI